MADTQTSSRSSVNGKSNLEMAQSNQDLIISRGTSKKRKWLITGVICLIALALAITAIILLNKSENNSISSAEALSLDDFLHGKFVPQSFNATWASGHELLYKDSNNNLVLLDLNTKSSKVFMNSSDELLVRAFDFQVSADAEYLLVAHDYQKLYRNSYLALYTVVELSTGIKTSLTTKPLQLVVWSPVGHSLVFVAENNIYHKNSPTDDTVVPLTATKGFISNGVPDWVYEEEVFSSNKALWFSPDGRKLAYARFDDTNVPVMVIPIYGEPGSLSSQYPRANIIKYPKAGTTNPKVTLHYKDLSDPTTEYNLQVPNILNSSEPILTAVEWATNSVCSSIWMNRVQNKASLVIYETISSSISITPRIIKNLEASVGWLELFTAPIFSKDGSKFLIILSQKQERVSDSFRHIVMFNVDEGSVEEALTNGTFVVSSILGWNHSNNLIYYLANTEEDSSVQHLYTVSPETKERTCLSCSLKSKNYESKTCSYNTAEMSKDSSYYELNCAGPAVPQISIYSTTSGKEILTWTINEDLVKLTKLKQIPVIKKLSFDIADGFTANVMLRLPPNLDTSGNTKYPMIVNVYGGPDTYQVIDKFVLDWGSYLASNKSIIYASIDGRGSGLRGDNIMFAGYRNLGTVEVIDQINVTRLIQKNLPYVDSTRTAIWGWSYGGYASGMALATDTTGVFKCGISVAPVTDWTLYDSIYTERFMGLPTVADNLEAYERAQLLNKYNGLKDKEYFLIHGTYDDNVHYQQSMLWSKILEQNDILFRQQSYPDEDHSLSLVRPHLYHSLEYFLDECFIEKQE